MTAENHNFTPIVPTIDDVAAQLAAEGEAISPLFMDKFDDPGLFEALDQNPNVDLTEAIRHTHRFDAVAHSVDIYGPPVEIPQADDNLHHDGSARRHESGRLIDLDKVRAAGVDPAQTLFFRVTQPSDEPKPEYYWTSDISETQHGLNVELGESAESAVVLVSTLEKVAENGGLIRDVNDDEGVPVRQIGLAPFNQHEALAVLKR